MCWLPSHCHYRSLTWTLLRHLEKDRKLKATTEVVCLYPTMGSCQSTTSDVTDGKGLLIHLPSSSGEYELPFYNPCLFPKDLGSIKCFPGPYCNELPHWTIHSQVSNTDMDLLRKQEFRFVIVPTSENRTVLFPNFLWNPSGKIYFLNDSPPERSRSGMEEEVGW